MLAMVREHKGMGGYGRRARRWSRDIFAAVALTLAAMALLGITFIGQRSSVPKPVASTADLTRE